MIWTSPLLACSRLPDHFPGVDSGHAAWPSTVWRTSFTPPTGQQLSGKDFRWKPIQNSRVGCLVRTLPFFACYQYYLVLNITSSICLGELLNNVSVVLLFFMQLHVCMLFRGHSPWAWCWSCIETHPCRWWLFVCFVGINTHQGVVGYKETQES
jgi:hypothetical protein